MAEIPILPRFLPIVNIKHKVLNTELRCRIL